MSGKRAEHLGNGARKPQCPFLGTEREFAGIENGEQRSIQEHGMGLGAISLHVFQTVIWVDYQEESTGPFQNCPAC